MTGAQPIRRRRGGWPTPEHMSPGCFALVMGTGIITIGAGQRGWHILADLLLILTALEYAVLVLLALWRVGRYRDLFVVDLKNPGVSFQFFTFVAGTNVLAAALAAHGHLTAATVGPRAPLAAAGRERDLVPLGGGPPLRGDRRGPPRAPRDRRHRRPRCGRGDLVVGGRGPLRGHRGAGDDAADHAGSSRRTSIRRSGS